MAKRRKFSSAYKARLVLELISGERSAAEIARKEQLKDTLLYEWRTQLIQHAPVVFSPPQANDELAQQVAELERLLGQLTVETELLKKASRWLSGMSQRNGNSPSSECRPTVWRASARCWVWRAAVIMTRHKAVVIPSRLSAPCSK